MDALPLFELVAGNKGYSNASDENISEELIAESKAEAGCKTFIQVRKLKVLVHTRTLTLLFCTRNGKKK